MLEALGLLLCVARLSKCLINKTYSKVFVDISKCYRNIFLRKYFRFDKSDNSIRKNDNEEN
jgi:hypothetical protein